MCNIIDGICELASEHPTSYYHNDPSLYYQIDGEMIEFQSAIKKISDMGPKYGYKVHAVRTRITRRIIDICEKMADKNLADSW